MSDNRVRLEFDISEETASEFDSLVNRCGLTTYGELLGNMFTHFVWSVEQAEKGRFIAGFDEKQKIFTKTMLPVLIELAKKQQNVH